MTLPSPSQTLESHEPSGATKAFSETLRKLWEVHAADLQRLHDENQRLLARLDVFEGCQSPEKDQKRDSSIPDDVPSVSSVTASDVPAARPVPANRTAWLPVVSSQSGIRKSGLFESTAIEMSSDFWFTVTRITRHPMFDIVVACIIFLNTIAMAIEAQWQGLSVGASINFGKIDPGYVASWTSAEQSFVWIGFAFGFVYVLELMLKLAGQRRSLLKFAWNWVDLVIILFWLIDITAGAILPVDATLLRVARLVRLLRLVQLMQAIKSLDALYIITTALSGSLSILAWACVLFFFLQMGLALLVNGYLTQYYFNDASISEANRQAVFEYFGTFSRSIYSMFEITLANWPPASRLLAENVSEWFMLFGVLHKLTIGFAVVSVVNGVFMQETFNVAASDDRVMIQKRKRIFQLHRLKMERFFHLADKSSDGAIDIDEFREMTEHKEVSAWLQAMELDVSDPDKLFLLIDSSRRDGRITLEELIRGVGRLKGSAKSLDVACMLEEVAKLHDLIVSQGFRPMPVAQSSPADFLAKARSKTTRLRDALGAKSTTSADGRQFSEWLRSTEDI